MSVNADSGTQDGGILAVLEQLLILMLLAFVVGVPWLLIVSSPIVQPTPGEPQACWRDAAFFVATGTVIGLVAAIKRPNQTRSGGWVWLLPSLVFLWTLIVQATQPAASYNALGPFYTDGSDIDGIFVPVVTLPTAAAVGYSAAVFMVGRTAQKRRGQDEGGRSL
jgi:hypothetical protein